MKYAMNSSPTFLLNAFTRFLAKHRWLNASRSELSTGERSSRLSVRSLSRLPKLGSSVYSTIFFPSMLFIVCCPSASAQVQLDRFYPPVVSIGSETNVIAEGSFPTWPVKAVVDREGVDVVVGTESGKLSLQLSTDAAPGVLWVRLFDESSASKLVPLLIEPAPTIEEVEPNQKIKEATAVNLPAIVYGRLATGNDVDTYRIHVRKGQSFVASTLAHRPLQSPMDAVMQLVDQHGNVIAQADDDHGIDPQLVYLADEDRDLYVRIFAFPEVPTGTIGYAGAASFVYAIRMTDDVYVDHVLPLIQPLPSSAFSRAAFGYNLPPDHDLHLQEATSQSPQIAYIPSSLGWQWQTSLAHDAVVVAETGGDDFATAPSLPCIFSGHISEPSETDRLRFAVNAATRYEAVVHSRAHGFPLDSVLRVISVSDGSELARNDDMAHNQYDATVTFTSKDAGEVELQLSDLVDGHGPNHAYSVVIGEALPGVALKVSENQFVINQDGNVEIPVTIARKYGFDRELVVNAEGLPEGIRSESAVSQATGETSTLVKLKLIADKTVAYQGAFRIIARPTSTEEKPTTAENFTASHDLRDAIRVDTFWLSAPPIKK